VRVDAQEAFTKRDEACNVENGVRCELVQLHAVNKGKPTKKFVGGDGKAVEEEGSEHYPEAFFGSRHDIVTGHLDLRPGGERACAA
jgi:hypothetical protein